MHNLHKFTGILTKNKLSLTENEVYKREKDAWKYVFEELDYHSDNGKITLFVKKE